MASAKTLSIRASVVLDDNGIPFQEYTSIGRLQLFSSHWQDGAGKSALIRIILGSHRRKALLRRSFSRCAIVA
jgi:hypothetical protein